MMKIYTTPLRYPLLLLLLLSLLSTTGCKPREREAKRLLVSVSLPPQKFFVEQILGDLGEVHVLVPKGSNPEYYDPTPHDLLTLRKSDAYFTIGTLPFEVQWTEQLPAEVEILNTASLLPEEYIYGHDGCAAHVHLHGDPHYWSSISGGRAMAEAYLQELLKLLPDESETLQQNYQSLEQTFQELEALAKELLGGSTKEVAFVIYHPSLSLFSDELGVKQLVIEENGLEPTPRHLVRLMEEAKGLDTRVVFIQQEFDQKNAERVAHELQLPLVAINPLNEAWDEEMRHLIKSFAPKA